MWNHVIHSESSHVNLLSVVFNLVIIFFHFSYSSVSVSPTQFSPTHSPIQGRHIQRTNFPSPVLSARTSSHNDFTNHGIILIVFIIESLQNFKLIFNIYSLKTMFYMFKYLVSNYSLLYNNFYNIFVRLNFYFRWNDYSWW